MLSEISIKHLRNITDLSIQPSSGINLLLGPNGSGKTSLLEAIHLLALGRSFRSRLLKTVVQFDQQALQVTAKMRRHNIPLGLQFDIKNGLLIRFNNSPLKKLSDLASQLPLQNIPANSHHFFEQGPRYRRQLLDWGLFHVEQSFNYHWQNYKKSIQQRNSALKQHKADSEIRLWDELLITHGEKISELRQNYLNNIKHDIKVIFKQLCPEFVNFDIDVKYHSGWPQEKTLSQAIEHTFIRDKQLAYTKVGPHRSDWTLKIDDHNAAEVLSRGQQKLFFIALCIAQIRSKKELEKGDGILLIDDLSSELDQEHLKLVVEQLSLLPVQIFISTSDDKLKQLILDLVDGEQQVFHVKQGEIV